MRRLALVLALALIACGGKPVVAPTPTPDPASDPFAGDALAVLAGLEDRLTAAPRVEIQARARAMGVIVADLRGTIVIEREVAATVEVKGSFAGTEIDTRWRSDAPVAENRRDIQSPVWADSLLIGITRMGAMHNWAMVVGGADPDIGNGDVRTWVQADQVAWKNDDPATRTLTFVIVVAGTPSGEAELTLDDRGLPLRRDVTVHFPEGNMRVVETYSRFTL